MATAQKHKERSRRSYNDHNTEFRMFARKAMVKKEERDRNKKSGLFDLFSRFHRTTNK